MDGLTRQVVRTRKWMAWTGTRDELRRVGGVVERLHSELQQVDDDLHALPELSKLLFETRARHGADIARHGEESVSGDLTRVIDELDGRTVRSLTFAIKPRLGSDTLRLEMDWKADFAAVELRISTSDPGWATKALGILSQELDKSVPRWSWLRTIWGHFLAGQIGFVALLWSGVFVSRQLLPGYWQLIVPGIIALCSWPFLFSNRAWSWLFPPIELKVEGATSTGSRRIVFAGSVLLAILIGIFVNVIS